MKLVHISLVQSHATLVLRVSQLRKSHAIVLLQVVRLGASC